MKSLRLRLAAFAAVGLITVSAYAADAAGTWKWTQASGRSGGTPREVTLTLTAKGGQLSGSVSMPGRDGATTTAAISNASLKGDAIAFEVEREYNGNKVVTKYAGKLQGDTIKGTVESPGRGGGEPQKRDWDAKRAK